MTSAEFWDLYVGFIIKSLWWIIPIMIATAYGIYQDVKTK